MDRFIPIIIMIVIFAVRAYANYQKEQEKARKRNPTVPPPLPEDNARHVKPMPVPVPSHVPTSSVAPEYEQYSGTVIPVEAVHQRRRERTRIPKQLVVELEGDQASNKAAEQFDLRDAVIKSAILDRPYS